MLTGVLNNTVRSKAIAAVLYLYTTGSLFEVRMNAYMSNGAPFPPLGLEGWGNSSGLEAVNSTLGVGGLWNVSLAGGESGVSMGEVEGLDTS